MQNMQNIMLRKKNSRAIVLHTESQFYLPGDEIVGTVTYHPKKAVSLRFVKIIFAGEECCVWIDKVAARVGGPVAASRAPLFRKETTLLADRTRVEAGPHTWQFRFVIPRAIPPTCNYNGKTSVTYWIKTKAATTFGHFNARFKLPVVIGQFWVPSIPAPVQTTHPTVGGNIVMSVKSSHSVVKCDDIVTLAIHFQNASYRNLTGVRVKLKQVWECTGVFYHKNVVMKYFTKEGFPTSRGPHDTVVQLKIPHRLYSCPTVTNASLFKCTYYLGVYGLTKMVGIVATEVVKCRIPITVSNLPTADHEGEASVGVPRPRSLPAYTETSSDDEDDEDDDADTRTHAHDAAHNAADSHAHSHARGEIDSQGNYAFLSSSHSSSHSLNHSHNDLGLGSLFNLDINDDSDSEKSDEKRGSKEMKEMKDKDKDKEEEGEKIGGECIVCYDGQKNMLMLPCAHIATCVSCTSYIMYSSKLCPVCRTKISQVMRIYPV